MLAGFTLSVPAARATGGCSSCGGDFAVSNFYDTAIDVLNQLREIEQKCSGIHLTELPRTDHSSRTVTQGNQLQIRVEDLAKGFRHVTVHNGELSVPDPARPGQEMLVDFVSTPNDGGVRFTRRNWDERPAERRRMVIHELLMLATPNQINDTEYQYQVSRRLENLINTPPACARTPSDPCHNNPLGPIIDGLSAAQGAVRDIGRAANRPPWDTQGIPTGEMLPLREDDHSLYLPTCEIPAFVNFYAVVGSRPNQNPGGPLPLPELVPEILGGRSYRVHNITQGWPRDHIRVNEVFMQFDVACSKAIYYSCDLAVLFMRRRDDSFAQFDVIKSFKYGTSRGSSLESLVESSLKDFAGTLPICREGGRPQR